MFTSYPFSISISSSISYANYPEFIEAEQLVLFKGFSHNETFKWEGKKFEHEISKIILDTVPDIEIHFTIKDEKPVFENPDLFKNPLVVSKGDIIAFIQDGYNGGLDRFGLSEGLEFYGDNENVLVVTGEGELDVSMRVNPEWYHFNFLSFKKYTPELAGKRLEAEDFYIKFNDKRYLSIDTSLDEIKMLLKGGNIEDLGASPNNGEVIYYRLEKDGMVVIYFDNPRDKEFEAYVEFLGVENPNHSTYRGLKVGDSYDRMIELYNEPDMEYDDGDTSSYYYGINNYDNDLAIIITIDNKTKLVTRFNVSLTL